MVEAILFDLDETLTDRLASISRYAALFYRDFGTHLLDVSLGDIESALVWLNQKRSNNCRLDTTSQRS